MNDATAETMGIAELAERAGVTPRTVRYYVAEGLLPAPGGRGQRRAYSQEHLRRLDMIRQLKDAYLPLYEIRRRLDAPASSPRPRTGEGDSVVAVGAVTSGAMPAAVSSIAVASVAARPPIGFGGAPGVGRIEIYEPTETTWRRHVLTPGIELHYRETDDPRLAEAIQRLIREAAAILDGRDTPEVQPDAADTGKVRRKR